MRPTIKAQVIELSNIDSEMAEFIITSCKIQLKKQILEDLDNDYAGVYFTTYLDKVNFIYGMYKVQDKVMEAIDFEASVKEMIDNYRKDNGLS